jgi:hypothetical protein
LSKIIYFIQCDRVHAPNLTATLFRNSFARKITANTRVTVLYHLPPGPHSDIGLFSIHFPTPAKRWLLEWDNDPYGDDYGADTYCKYANRDVFVAILVETPLGIQNLPEMLKVPGIDAIMLGSGDLSIRMGLTLWDAEVAQIVADATRMILEAGKISCPIALPTNIEKLYRGGVRMVMLGFSERKIIQDAIRGTMKQMNTIISSMK